MAETWLDNWFSENSTKPSERYQDYMVDGSHMSHDTLTSHYKGDTSAYSLYGMTTNKYDEGAWAHKWHPNDHGGNVARGNWTQFVTDPLTGIATRGAQIQTRGSVFEQYTNSGSLIQYKFPDGTVRYRRLSVVDGYSAQLDPHFSAKFNEYTKSKGRPEWGGKNMTEIENIYADWIKDTDLEPPPPPQTPEDKEADDIRLKVQREIAQGKQEATDISEQETLRAQQAVARQSGATQRALQAQLASQTGMSPEETSQMLAGGAEGIARMQSDVAQQSNLLKMKSLADLTKFGTTAGLSADELATKLQSIASQRQTALAGLENQFNIAQLQSDTQRYGMGLDYQAALRQAQAQTDAAKYQMWGNVAGAAGNFLGNMDLG
tara:strand:- start:3269 stop:4399 length:1131 start_codon:yes stop_codon:yes gene_type:complete